MTGLLTSKQMRSIEQLAIESGEVSGIELMEKAGRGVVSALIEKWPQSESQSWRAAVLCGPGNNGGDGFVVARILEGKGWAVRVFLYGDSDALPKDAKVNHDLWSEIGSVEEFEVGKFKAGAFDLYVDALFGSGLARPLKSDARDALEHIAFLKNQKDFGVKIVSIDAPSGMCMDSGRILGSKNLADIPFADLTVAFDSPKAGHFLEWGPLLCGKLAVVDIGLEKWRNRLLGNDLCEDASLKSLSDCGFKTQKKISLVDPNDQFQFPGNRKRGVWSRGISRENEANDHKYSHGHVLVLSGGKGQTGAARLAARGALRTGAGLVTLGVHSNAHCEAACQVTSIMLKRVDDSEGLASLLMDARFNVICLGPGLGIERARELMPVALSAVHKPSVVLDADALTAYSQQKERLFEMLHDKCVLTPHAGEFGRLFVEESEKLARPPCRGPCYSKFDATRQAAKKAGCVVLYKGADTVIASPDGECGLSSARYARKAPWLATAGSGDVLAGMISGLIAQGANAMQAAQFAAWLHVECAISFGPGLISEDLPEELPKVLYALEQSQSD